MLPPDHPDTVTTRHDLAEAYEHLERWSDAEPLWRNVLAHRRGSENTDSPILANDLAGLGLCLWKQSKWAEAEPSLRECLAIRQKAIPDDWSRYHAMSQLGEALLGQRKFADAEPLIARGYDGMHAQRSGDPASKSSPVVRGR